MPASFCRPETRSRSATAASARCRRAEPQEQKVITMPTKKTLSDLKAAVVEKAAAAPAAAHVPGAATTAPLERVQTLDAKGRAYGTGRRKDAVAKVWVSRGSGKIIVNDRDVVQYFARGTQRLVINQPFEVSARVGQFDVKCVVSGGGDFKRLVDHETLC